MQRQNQELLRALEELEQRQDELPALNRELEDTNRGVVALYAELDEKADHLRRADELKSRFLSNMSHEFRTPVNSILALARLLLERTDGDLTAEQERQVTFIRKAADGSGRAGRTTCSTSPRSRPARSSSAPSSSTSTTCSARCAACCGRCCVNESVALVFDEPEDIAAAATPTRQGVADPAQLHLQRAQVHRARRGARLGAGCADGDAVAFAVADTGIGIAAEDQERIFQEFTQIDSPMQRRVQGTGLGLPLCRKLAELLGGAVARREHARRRLDVHRRDPGASTQPVMPVRRRPGSSTTRALPVLVVEDSSETLLLYEKMLTGAAFQLLPARTLREAREALAPFRPRAIVLDILLRGEDAWAFLAELKRRPDLHDIPVAVVSTVDDERKASRARRRRVLR